MAEKYSGLVLYHGHGRQPLPDNILTKDTKWTYIHKNSEVQPDIVGDITNPLFLLQLGLNQYDKVVIWFGSNKSTYFARALLKPNGLLYRNNYFGYITHKYLEGENFSMSETSDLMRSIKNEIISRKDEDHISVLKESVIWNLIESDLLEKQLVYHDIQLINEHPHLVSVFRNSFTMETRNDLDNYKGLILESKQMTRLYEIIPKDEWLLCPFNTFCVKFDELRQYGFNSNDEIVVQIPYDTRYDLLNERIKAYLSAADFLLKSGGHLHMINIILAAIERYSQRNSKTYPIEKVDVSDYKEGFEKLELEKEALKSNQEDEKENNDKLVSLTNEQNVIREKSRKAVRRNYENVFKDVKERYLNKDDSIVEAIHDIVIELPKGSHFSISSIYNEDLFSLSLVKV